MELSKSKLKTWLIRGLAPELVSTLVGVIIGLITHNELSELTLLQNLLKWIININAGAVAHQIAWLIYMRAFKVRMWDSSSTLKAIWKPTALGVFLTVLIVFFLFKAYFRSPKEILIVFLQVIAICAVVHAFLFQFKFYDRLRNSIAAEHPELAVQAASDTTEPVRMFIPLQFNERIEKVNLELVSHIKVEDHYCTVVYLKDNQWQQWTVYGKLKHFETKYASQLLRINRSVLANPKMVAKVEKSGGRHLITMKGDPATPFTLSDSQKHLLERLVPVIG